MIGGADESSCDRVATMTTLPKGCVGMGRRPALLIVDAMLGFTDPTSPLGTQCDDEIAVIGRLLDRFRRLKLPVVFTTNTYGREDEARVFRSKLPALNLLSRGSQWAAIDPRVLPLPDEQIVNKGLPSAFFDTTLRQDLRRSGVDTVVVVGFSTSGCVRATAVDALQADYRVLVVREACGDRDRGAHDANLRDLDLKYADVVSAEELMQMIDVLPGEEK